MSDLNLPQNPNDLRKILVGEYESKSKTYYMKNNSEKHVSRKEGDTWEEDGKKWIIKNGIRTNIVRYTRDDLGLMPNFCPECGKLMKGRYDKKYWLIHKLCFKCSIHKETKMRINGTWEEYEKNKVKANVLAYLKDIREKLFEQYNNIGNVELARNGEGDVEVWNMEEADVKFVKEDIMNEILKIDDKIKEIEQGDL